MSDKDPSAFRTISEVAEELDLPQHVLRFWETKFSQIRPMKSSGGRRFYRPDDIVLLRAIREMLYGQGYTIRGVQRLLKERGARGVLQMEPDASATEQSEASTPVLDVTVPMSVAVGHSVSEVLPRKLQELPADIRAIRDELQACVRILRDARA